MAETKYEYFGKYILCEKLNQGGMASVYLAKALGNEGLAKFFAVKRILPQYSNNSDFIEMFKTEAKVAINLHHSNIVQIFDFGTVSDQFYIAMEYVKGPNLRQVLKKLKPTNQSLSVPECAYIMREVAAGLDHAHRCIDGMTGEALQLTHRDMSPQNIMVSFEGEIKVIDFGIAKIESELEKTQAGMIKGKFSYMSPEQADGQEVDPRTDVFSSGIILWELLTGERLFSSADDVQTLRKVRQCDVPSIRKINPSVPAELERITQKALAKDRNLRYQSAAAFERDLSRFLSSNYPEFSSHEFVRRIKDLFSSEIETLRLRLMKFSKITEKDVEGIDPSSPTAQHDTVVPTKAARSQIQPTNVTLKKPIEITRNQTRATSFETRTRRPSSQTRFQQVPPVKRRSKISAKLQNLATGLAIVGIVGIIGKNLYQRYESELKLKKEETNISSNDVKPIPSPPIKAEETVSVAVTTEPSGAQVYIDGEPTGMVTPARMSVVKGKEFKISLRKEGFLSYDQTLNLTSTDSLSFPLLPVSVGYITVTVPFGENTTELFIDGVKLPQRPPLLRHPVPAGRSIKVMVRNRGGAQAEETVRVDKDREKKLTLVPVLSRRK